MQFKHKHHAGNEVVYRFPINPKVSEQRDRKGERINWSVRMEIEITRADNRLINNRWEYPVASFPEQHLDARYSREQVISYFHMHHSPHGDEISEDAYKVLKQEYEAKARSRKWL